MLPLTLYGINIKQKRNNEQIPKEDDTRGKTGQVISEQSGVEGQRKEVNVESYSKVAALGQILKDMEFPADKNKVIEYVKQSSNAQIKEEVLTAVQQKLEERKETLEIETSAVKDLHDVALQDKKIITAKLRKCWNLITELEKHGSDIYDEDISRFFRI